MSVLSCPEVNEHTISLPGEDAAVCHENLRKWRKSEDNTSLLGFIDKSYLQSHIVDSLK